MDDILQSTWLIQMLEKSSQTPQERLLALFDILENWLNAPHVQLPSTSLTSTSPVSQKNLQTFLALQARQLKLSNPDLLADQIYFIAFAACKQFLQNRETDGFNHARSAASALVTVQLNDSRKARKVLFSRPLTYGIAASLTILFIALFISTYPSNEAFTQKSITSISQASTASQAVDIANPVETAELYGLLEQMRNGNCRLIEAITIPDKDKALYIESIVEGKVPTSAHQQRIVRDYLQQIPCNYTPMLMANSRG